MVALLAPLSCMLNPLDLDVNLKILMFSSADLLSSVRIKIHVRGTVLNRIAPLLGIRRISKILHRSRAY